MTYQKEKIKESKTLGRLVYENLTSMRRVDMKQIVILISLSLVFLHCSKNPLSEGGGSRLGSESEGLNNLNPITSIQFVAPYASPGSAASPLVQIYGAKDFERVIFYTDELCTESLSEQTADGDNPQFNITFTQPGSYSVYVRRFDDARDLSSPCSSQFLSYQLLATNFPSVAITLANDIDASNELSYNIVGTCSVDGQDVILSVGSLTVNVTCSGGSFAILGLDMSSVADQSNLSLVANHSDGNGFWATPSQVFVNKDTASDTVSITSATDINVSNQGNYSVQGSCSSNGDVVDIFIDSINVQVLCGSGFWNSGFVDVSALADNPSLPITADHLTAPQASTTVVKDVTAPVVTISSAPNITQVNETSYQTSGTCSDSGQNVSVSVGGINQTVSCSSNTWVVSGLDTSSLADAASISVTADHSNAMATPAPQASTTISKVTTLPSISQLSVAATLSASADLVWTTVDPGGFVFNDYQVQYRIDGTSTWLSFADGESTNQQATVTGLQASTTYQFRVRLRYDTSQLTDWSPVASGTTKSNNPLFSSPYKVMNVAGAVQTNVVAYYDNTVVTLNGTPIADSPLSAGQVSTLTTNSTPFEVIDADKPIFVAGRRGSGSDNAKGNTVWNSVLWAGKSFSFNATRDNAQELRVYAVEDTTVTVKQGTTVLASATISEDNGATLTWSTYGSYQVISTGLILAYHVSINSGTRVTDPKPLLPSTTEIIGFPSSSMRLTADLDGTNYNILHSNSNSSSGSLDRADVVQISPQGTSSQYQSNSLLISGDKAISGASFADANGNCAAPFMPTSLMKTRYAINASSDWVAFASKSAGTIDVYSPGQQIGVDTPVQTLTFTRSGANSQAPYYVRRASTPQGYRFVSTVPMAVWYQPSTDVGAAMRDETILYGTDD